MASATLSGDVLAIATIVAIVIAAGVTTALETMRAQDDLKRRGWSEPRRACALVAVGTVMFCGGGWLVVDLIWGLRRVSRVGWA